ncbi:MAG: protein-glutamate O-methyltransferase CheR [Candidatus Binatia bacterium]
MAGGFVITDEEFRFFRTLLMQEAGISLGEGKRHLVASRLAKRLRYFGFTSYKQYYHYLMTEDPSGDERLVMVNCLTTNKTDFFREGHHFDFLRERVLPALREKTLRGAPRRLRIWSAACSSGEEPYTIAMTVREMFPASSGWDIRILASDIDTDILRRAERGIYDQERLAGVPENLQRKYFLRGKGQWEGSVRVRPELRELITFRRINFIDPVWPIHTCFDVIFCRNVIIYFDRETQRRLFERLAGYLDEDGYMMVGHSESLHWLGHLFVPLRGTIYQPRAAKRDQ